MFCPACRARDQHPPQCARCAAPLAAAPRLAPAYVVSEPSGMAIAGFVLAFFCGLFGLIFSAIGLAEIKRSNGALTGEGLAIGGIIISIISLAISLALVGGSS